MKTFITFCIVIFFFGCKISSKDEDLKEIEDLSHKIYKNNKALHEQKETIKKLEDNINLEISKVRATFHQKDSIIKLNKIINAIDASTINNVFTDFYNAIDYEVTSNDSYWERGPYYTSENKNENFYNVKTTVVNGQLFFYFIGVKYPLEGDKVFANVYELNENKELYIIDTIDISPGIKIDREDDPRGEWHLREFILLQLDNLIVKNDKLFYFKIKDFDNSTHHIKNSKKEFYEYTIGSKIKSKKTFKTILSNVIVEYADDIKLISPDKTKLVRNYGEVMMFYKILNWNKDYKSIYLDNATGEQLNVIDFDLSKHFKETEDGLYGDTDTGKDLLFGGASWHSKKSILYFDNSGMTFRCIWKIDFDNNEVTKIVPEHEAIHPYFFQTYDKTFIAYVENNKIMLCEAPNNGI